MANIQNKATKDKKDHGTKTNVNWFVKLVIALITFTFVLTGTSLIGINQFFQDIFKEKIKNEDGSISIPRDAPIAQNSDNPDTYIGKILGEKIRLNQQDEFNYNFAYIYESKSMNPIQKFYQTRAAYDQAINKIIGMHNAKAMDIIITKKYLIDEVGKRYYVDADGDINHDLMKKDVNTVNQRGKTLIDSLYYENFVYDYFQGLPVSHDEAWYNYKLENLKLSLKYIDISNTKVDDNQVNQYFNANKENYKQYKLAKIVYDKQKKPEAEATLNELKANPSKFYEIGNKLKSENKIINMISDTDFSFISSYEDVALQDAVKKTDEGKIGDSLIDTQTGLTIFLVEKMKFGELSDPQVKQKVDDDYIQSHSQEINNANKAKAEEIYKYAAETNLDKAALKFNQKVESVSSPVTFKGYIPNLNMDQTDDVNFMVSLFKSEVGKSLAPYKYANGYMIMEVSERKEPSKDTFDELFTGLYTRYSEDKKRNIELDYYASERKRYTFVDNFKYVFNYQMFMPKQGEDNGQPQGLDPNIFQVQ